MGEKTFLIKEKTINGLKEMKKNENVDYGKLADKIAELKEMEDKLKARRVELQKKLTEQLPRPLDKATLYVEGSKAKLKVSWTESYKISQKEAKIFAERYPRVAQKVFSITYKPKKSSISTMERTIKDAPEYEKPLLELKQIIKIEEDVRVSIEKAGEKDE
ncbi:hypothetical protein SAMN02745164_00490 [Marinitoga hydrogenitolerans DSM 16785]|uniref:Uncharacterized protein n=1 Tax=Marinitoga hydrogenitolerans (strain DSM 16785 / JCM 12826 / AT1271) TaxID=1122195 RepID=A0A1M4TRX0_MARH1|nr:hypothetical protein [Marinitoga hydrogenitolerans]SHE47249.1 hypothetical protein SAMN02745164_00490 [Marinitoga hydrogenitolerans DSM 16785]